jgi:NAD(P)-dependent dehydrogenase (short-subunit alcohol dehydrogenase family)
MPTSIGPLDRHISPARTNPAAMTRRHSRTKLRRIINLHDIHTVRRRPKNYAASKAALSAFFRALARNPAARNVTSTAWRRALRYRLFRDVPEEVLASTLAMKSFGRLPPRMRFGRVAFLASDDASKFRPLLLVNGAQ